MNKKKNKEFNKFPNEEIKTIRLRWLSQGATITIACRDLGAEFVGYTTDMPLVEIAFSFCCPTDNFCRAEGEKRAHGRFSFYDKSEDRLSEEGREKLRNRKRNRVRVAARTGVPNNLNDNIIAALKHMHNHNRLPTWLSNELKRLDKLMVLAKPLLQYDDSPVFEKVKKVPPYPTDPIEFLVNCGWLYGSIIEELKKQGKKDIP